MGAGNTTRPLFAAAPWDGYVAPMVATRTETIIAADGATFDGFLALPESGSGPGVLVIQEIFGVNTYIQQVCKRLAALGYVAMAPDCFHRQGAGFAVDRTGPEAVGEGIGKATKHDAELGVSDLGAALTHLRGLSEVGGGKVGVTGFCFGGLMTYLQRDRAPVLDGRSRFRQRLRPLLPASPGQRSVGAHGRLLRPPPGLI